MNQEIKKILIANRGEIALRVIRACRELGIKSVALYSDPDRDALHVRRADEAYYIGPAAASESYLRADKVIEIAKKSGADAIHPGYGFLSENADFARQIQSAGIIFIGPDPDIIDRMGSKIEARKIATAAGVPLIPGIQRPLKDAEEAAQIAEEIGYPVLLKAAMGGGGKGMRSVFKAEEIKTAFELATNEAIHSFKDSTVYMEKLVEEPHHIEVQIMGDRHGNVIHLFERECSVQRRHQKVIEESPSPYITEETRKKVCEVAVQLSKHVGYQNAGTIEMLVDKHQDVYFLEMNTRLQVEHPITEEVTQTDLVKLQIHVAAGKELPIKQEDIKQKGWAIECRIYAEDPFSNFMPSPGKIIDQQYPHGPGIRLDNGVYSGFTVSMDYDPILSKLISYAATREEAIERMQRALSEYKITGIKTNLYFHGKALARPDFKEGKYDTSFIANNLDAILEVDLDNKKQALKLAAIAKYLNDKKAIQSDSKSTSIESNWKRVGREKGLRTR